MAALQQLVFTAQLPLGLTGLLSPPSVQSLSSPCVGDVIPTIAEDDTGPRVCVVHQALPAQPRTLLHPCAHLPGSGC